MRDQHVRRQEGGKFHGKDQKRLSRRLGTDLKSQHRNRETEEQRRSAPKKPNPESKVKEITKSSWVKVRARRRTITYVNSTRRTAESISEAYTHP